jgi:cyclase
VPGAALAASIFHYNEFSIPFTKAYLAERGVPVRLVPTGGATSRRSPAGEVP